MYQKNPSHGVTAHLPFPSLMIALGLVMTTFAAALVSCSTAVEWGKGKAADTADSQAAALTASAQATVPDLATDDTAVKGAKKIVGAAIREAIETGDLQGSVSKYARTLAEFLGALLLGLLSAWLRGGKLRAEDALGIVTGAVEASGQGDVKASVKAKAASAGLETWLYRFLKSRSIS